MFLRHQKKQQGKVLETKRRTVSQDCQDIRRYIVH